MEPRVPMSFRLHVVYRHAEPDTTSWGPRTYKYDGSANIRSSLSIRLPVKVCIHCARMCVWVRACFGCACTFCMLFPDTCLCLLVAFMRFVCSCMCVCLNVKVSIWTTRMHVSPTQLMMSTSQWAAELMWEFLFLHPAFISRWDSISPVRIAS